MRFSEFVVADGAKLFVVDRASVGNRMLHYYNQVTGETVYHISVTTCFDLAKELVFAAESFELTDGDEKRSITDEVACYLLDELIQSKDDSFFIPKNSRAIHTSEKVYELMNQLRLGKIRLNPAAKYMKELEELIEEFELYLMKTEHDLGNGVVAKKNAQIDNTKLVSNAYQIMALLEGKEEEIQKLLPYGKTNQVTIGVMTNHLTFKEKEILRMLAEAYHTKVEEIEWDIAENSKEQVHTNFVCAYGAYNEVNYIAERIKKEKQKYGEVVIYYTTPEYENYLSAIFESREIPICFTGVKHAMRSDFVQIMLGILEWMDNHKDAEALSRVKKNKLFQISPVKWSEDQVEYQKNVDQFESQLKDLFVSGNRIADTYASLLEFVNKYTYTCKPKNLMLGILREKKPIFEVMDPAGYINQVPCSSKYSIKEQIKLIREFLEEVTYQEAEEYNAVRAVFLNKFDCIDRSYAYFCGLSASQMNKQIPESPVMSDEEIGNVLEDEGYIKLAKNSSKEFAQEVESTIGTMVRGEITYLYSKYNSVDLRMSAPSVFYLEKKEQSGKEAKEQQYNYAPLLGQLWNQEEAQKAFVFDSADLTKQFAGLADEAVEEIPSVELVQAASINYISSSALEKLLKCPLQYYYHYIRHIPEEEYEKFKAEEWLDPKNKGTVFHRVMELYCNSVFCKSNTTVAPRNELALEDAIQKAVKEMKAIVLPPSQYIEDYEVEALRNAARGYLFGWEEQPGVFVGGLHSFFENDVTNKAWKVIGCELGFGIDFRGQHLVQVDYLEQNAQAENVTLHWKGSIDRLDGYVDTKGCLHLVVSDYKTGSYKNLQEGIDGKQKQVVDEVTGKKITVWEKLPDQKVQHYIYASAALTYVQQKRSEIEKQFSNVSITDVMIDDFIYVFPFETGKKVTLSVKEKISQVLEQSATDPFAWSLTFPERVSDRIWEFFGNEQNNRADEVEPAINERAKEMIKKEEAKRNPYDPHFHTTCDYCSYKEICRMKLWEMWEM